MSIDTAASVLQTVSTIREQLTRGLTISVENNHSHYHLRNMEYWSETDCFNAPTITIGPGKWGVGAFESKVTCGTKGILCYELLLDERKLKNRLFLLIGWSAGNTTFIHLSPEVEEGYAEVEDEKSLPPSSLSVCATMATSAIANLKVEINPYLERITNVIKSPLLIPSPGSKFSITKYMEKSLQNAEEMVNGAFKYMGIEDESDHSSI
ncbi:14850_t:CDS:2 [Funneliformis caledonium]|uniref:14850_t:CDS:1 n=1 Tax=Funneliformis caledonium TaxID=1117310 RepID=A0A9N9DJ86_9GLOM|nr:14850_t:CDS:2 [Funneliformis caledonium]